MSLPAGRQVGSQESVVYRYELKHRRCGRWVAQQEKTGIEPRRGDRSRRRELYDEGTHLDMIDEAFTIHYSLLTKRGIDLKLHKFFFR